MQPRRRFSNGRRCRKTRTHFGRLEPGWDQRRGRWRTSGVANFHQDVGEWTADHSLHLHQDALLAVAKTRTDFFIWSLEQRSENKNILCAIKAMEQLWDFDETIKIWPNSSIYVLCRATRNEMALYHNIATNMNAFFFIFFNLIFCFDSWFVSVKQQTKWHKQYEQLAFEAIRYASFIKLSASSKYSWCFHNVALFIFVQIFVKNWLRRFCYCGRLTLDRKRPWSRFQGGTFFSHHEVILVRTCRLW